MMEVVPTVPPPQPFDSISISSNSSKNRPRSRVCQHVFTYETEIYRFLLFGEMEEITL